MLLTTDGTGSGLDADTVDGYHAADLLDRDNHTGVQAISTVTNLQANLDLKAPIADPVFTGTVTIEDELASNTTAVSHIQDGLPWLEVTKIDPTLVNIAFKNCVVIADATQSTFTYGNSITSRSSSGRAFFLADDERPALTNIANWVYNVAGSNRLGGTLLLEQSGGAPTQSGDGIGSIYARGKWDANGGDNPTPGYIMFVSAGAWASGNCSMDIVFGATPVGSQTAVEHFRVTGTGAKVTGTLQVTGAATASNLSGTNTGDQTTIVGITGTKAQFNTANSDGDFLFTSDIGTSVQAYDADLDAVASSGLAAAWTTYTPTVAAGVGAFTSVSASGRYKQIGKIVFVRILVTITTNGTASSFWTVTGPVAAVNALDYTPLFARELASPVGVAGQGVIQPGATTIYVQKYDGTYLGGNGFRIAINGTYEAA
jgi:hypothetical protein